MWNQKNINSQTDTNYENMKIRIPFRKNKANEEQKEVEYQPLGENAYHIKATIDDERFDIISYGFPQEKKEDIKAVGDLSAEGAKIESQKDKLVKGSWDAVVKTEQYGFLPIETWKKISEKVAGTLTIATGSPASSEIMSTQGSYFINLSLPKMWKTYSD
jgi:hypothetical protein